MKARLIVSLAALTLAAAAHAQLAPLPAATSSVNPRTPTIQADDNKTLTGNVPLDSKAVPDPTDVAATASPLDAQRRGLYLRPGTAITLRLAAPASSGTLHNGQLLDATLLHSIRNAAGTTYPAGTPVKVTVLSTAPAGKIQSAGVLSIQVERVGSTAVITNVLEFDGHEGPKEIADAAPAKGTEATIQGSATLNFKVLGPGDTPAPDKTDNQGNSIGNQGAGSQAAGSQAGQSTGSKQPNASTPQPTPGATSNAPGAVTPH